MSRKILAWILTGIISVLLIGGCSAGTGGQNGTDTDTEQTNEEAAADALPSEIRVGIACAGADEEYPSAFINKIKEYFVAAGVVEGRITQKRGAAEEIAGFARELIGSGCSVLVIGNADPKDVPGITDAADEAGAVVLYFGTDPGEAETARWEGKKLRASYAGSTYAEASSKRADVLETAGIEEIDQSGDEEIGVLVLGSGGEEPGDAVNQETLRILGERGLPVRMLEEEADESGEETDTAEEADESGEETDTAEEADESSEETDTAEEANAAEEDPASNRRNETREEVIRCMEEYGKELEVILCSDDIQALGALDAVRDEKKLVGHDVMIFGFDCSSESLREAASGSIVNTFFRDFMEQSKTLSETALALLRGDSAKVRSSCEYVSVTVDNAQEILDITLKSLDAGQKDGEDEESSEDGETGDASEENETEGEDTE